MTKELSKHFLSLEPNEEAANNKHETIKIIPESDFLVSFHEINSNAVIYSLKLCSYNRTFTNCGKKGTNRMQKINMSEVSSHFLVASCQV